MERSNRKNLTEVVCGVIARGNDVLVTKRPANRHLEDYWEFPGGKVDPGETLEAAMKRELQEELGIEVEVLNCLETFEYDDAGTLPKPLLLYFFLCRMTAGDPKPLAAEEMRWVKSEDLVTLRFPPADQNLIKRLPRILRNSAA